MDDPLPALHDLVETVLPVAYNNGCRAHFPHKPFWFSGGTVSAEHILEIWPPSTGIDYPGQGFHFPVLIVPSHHAEAHHIPLVLIQNVQKCLIRTMMNVLIPDPHPVAGALEVADKVEQVYREKGDVATVVV